MGEGCWKGVRTYLLGNVLQWCRLFKRWRKLPAEHCVEGVKAAEAVSEPTCQALCCRGAGCLSGVRTYLPGNVLQWCRLFKRCQTYLPGNVLQWCRLFKRCQTYLPGNVLQWCRLFKQCQTYLPGNVLQLCRLFKRCQTYLQGNVLQWCRLMMRCPNLPAGQCIAVVQAV